MKLINQKMTNLYLSSRGVARAQFWFSLFLQTNMEGCYRRREVLWDFVVKATTRRSPAGKAYTHQFAEHRSFSLSILCCPLISLFSPASLIGHNQIDSNFTTTTRIFAEETKHRFTIRSHRGYFFKNPKHSRQHKTQVNTTSSSWS